MRVQHLLVFAVLLSGACAGSTESNTEAVNSSAMQCTGPTLPAELADYLAATNFNGSDCQAIENSGQVMVRFKVPGEEAISTWDQLAAVADNSGYWPVLMGTQQSAEQTLAFVGTDFDDVEPSPEQVLADAENIVFEDWLEQRTDLILSDIRGELGGGFPSDGQIYPSPAEAHVFVTPRDIFSGEFHDTVVMAIVPAVNSWESAAFLSWGCWNENPCPEEHVAVLREWNDRYGADIVAMAGDTLEMRVDHPPTEWEDALQLAREQYVYDHDIVDQGAESIEVLASFLLGSEGWYFWWD